MISFLFTTSEENTLIIETENFTCTYDLNTKVINASKLVEYLGTLNQNVVLDTSIVQKIIEEKKRSAEFITMYNYIRKIIETYIEVFEEISKEFSGD